MKFSINQILQTFTNDKKQGKILIPVFALDRLQKILSFLYENFKNDKFLYDEK